MRYYLVDDDPDLRFDDVDELIDYCVNVDYFEDDSTSFDEYLDQDGDIYIGDNSFLPSAILYQMDEAAYLDAKHDWAENCAESERDDAYSSATSQRPGTSFYVCSYEVFIYEQDENEDLDGDDTSVDERISQLCRLAEERQAQEQEEKSAEIAFESLFQHI